MHLVSMNQVIQSWTIAVVPFCAETALDYNIQVATDMQLR